MAEAAANVEECLHASGLSFFYFSDVMAVQAYSEVAVTATMDAAASGLSSFFSSVAAWALMAVQAVADVAVDANTGMSMQIPA